MLGEKLNDALAEGRFDDVGDEAFLAQFGEIGAAALGEAVLGRDHEGQLVAEDLDGGELRLLGNEGGDAEVEAIVQELAGNVAREGAADGQMDFGIQSGDSGPGREAGRGWSFR